MKAVTIFTLDSREYNRAQSLGYTAIRSPWQGGNETFIASFASMCKSRNLRPCLIYDGLEGMSESEIQAGVKAASYQMSTLVNRFDVQCGVEIEDPTKAAATFALAKEIASWSRGNVKIAPPVLVIGATNSDYATISWCMNTITTLYANKGALTPSIDVYVDHAHDGTVDEIAMLNLVNRAFQDVGIGYGSVYVAEAGMNTNRKGSLSIGDAYDRLWAALIRSRYPYIASFAMMDGIDGNGSFGQYTTGYALTTLGAHITSI